VRAVQQPVIENDSVARREVERHLVRMVAHRRMVSGNLGDAVATGRWPRPTSREARPSRRRTRSASGR
jgi:hypothetical protein